MKEIQFFNDDSRYLKGPKWYEMNFKNFNLLNPAKFVDATPEYITSELSLERIKKYKPDAKILVVLREPVSRAYSAWNFYARLPKFSNQVYDFIALIQDEINHIRTSSPFKLASLGIVRYGCYSTQLAALFQNFPAGQVLIIGSHELNSNTHEVLTKIFRFLNVSAYDPSKCITRQRNKGTYNPIPLGAKEILTDFYRPYNTELFEMLGYEPEW